MAFEADQLYPKWFKLPTFDQCKEQVQRCIILVNSNNNQEFLIQTSKRRPAGGVDLVILKYDARAHSNESSKLLCSIPAHFKDADCHLNAMSNGNELYLYDRTNEAIDVINVKKKKRKVIRNVPKGRNFVVIGNQIHILNNAQHHCFGLIQSDSE